MQGLPADDGRQKRVGDAAAAAMGSGYVSTHAGEGNFIGAGGCDDWMHEIGTMLSFTVSRQVLEYTSESHFFFGAAFRGKNG